jgi:hypothetical protein
LCATNGASFGVSVVGDLQIHRLKSGDHSPAFC